MYIKPILILLTVALMACPRVYSQKEVLYKQVDTTQLFMDVFYPEHLDSAKSYPAMVFFFGGGWVKGNRIQFVNHAKYFSKRGLVCFLADYRTETKHNTTPFEALKDAKSAIRFIRKHALEFKIDPTKIIVSGGSAGGHLAAATAFITAHNDSKYSV